MGLRAGFGGRGGGQTCEPHGLAWEFAWLAERGCFVDLCGGWPTVQQTGVIGPNDRSPFPEMASAKDLVLCRFFWRANLHFFIWIFVFGSDFKGEGKMTYQKPNEIIQNAKFNNSQIFLKQNMQHD